MNASVLLRIAAVFILLFGVGHSLGYPWVGNVTEAQQTALMDAIQANTAVTMGFMRSYADFHVGFGWFISIFFLVQAIVVWRLASLLGVQPAVVKFLSGLFAVQYLATLVLDYYFFFWAPIISAALVAACFLAVYLNIEA
ncbi:MAG TPA: hypothetical protein VKG66_03675 [Steroidobacteraceae bacterium]|nr:hypothetical protein [Steroidobacteraceae bacterium]